MSDNIIRQKLEDAKRRIQVCLVVGGKLLVGSCAWYVISFRAETCANKYTDCITIGNGFLLTFALLSLILELAFATALLINRSEARTGKIIATWKKALVYLAFVVVGVLIFLAQRSSF